MPLSQRSEDYKAWRKVLIEILGETTTEVLERMVQNELESREVGERDSGRG